MLLAWRWHAEQQRKLREKTLRAQELELEVARQGCRRAEPQGGNARSRDVAERIERDLTRAILRGDPENSIGESGFDCHPATVSAVPFERCDSLR